MLGGLYMNIDIWLDFTCPFCFIGKKRFEKALNKFKHKDIVSVKYKSYLLQPYFSNDENLNCYEMLAKHKDISLDEAKKRYIDVAHMAFDDGLACDFDLAIPASTLVAHKVMKLIHDNTKQSHFIDDMYKAHFEHGEDISQLDILLKYGLKQGLDKESIEQAFLSNDIVDLIKQDINQAEQIGVRGVPFFVANQKYGMAGAQPAQAFYEMLEELYYESVPKRVSKTEFCEGEHCERRKK